MMYVIALGLYRPYGLFVEDTLPEPSACHGEPSAPMSTQRSLASIPGRVRECALSSA